MFKSTLISLAMLAVAPLALADNCTGGLSYCGSSLLKKGKYTDQINQALLVAGQPTDYDHVHKSIFYCLGGSSGAIQYTTYCSGSCNDNGQGRSDTCA